MLLLPKDSKSAIKLVSLVASLVSLALTHYVWHHFDPNAGLMFIDRNPGEVTSLGVFSTTSVAKLQAVTGDRMADVLLDLHSNTGVFGQPGSLRGWQMIRKGGAGNLSFSFYNTDTGDSKPTITRNDMVVFDGFNNRMIVDGATVFNNSSGAYDFQVKGATDANLLYVQANSDKVGIGTTTPNFKLTVAGGVNVTDNYYINGVPLTTVNAGSITGQTLYWNGAAYAPTTSVFVASNGFVGIGTTTTLNRLSVEGGIHLTSSTPANTTYAFYNYGGQLYWNGNPIVTGGNTSTYISDANQDTMVQTEETPNEDKIHFNTAGVERMVIDNTGKIGMAILIPPALIAWPGSITDSILLIRPVRLDNFGYLTVWAEEPG